MRRGEKPDGGVKGLGAKQRWIDTRRGQESERKTGLQPKLKEKQMIREIKKKQIDARCKCTQTTLKTVAKVHVGRRGKR